MDIVNIAKSICNHLGNKWNDNQHEATLNGKPVTNEDVKKVFSEVANQHNIEIIKKSPYISRISDGRTMYYIQCYNYDSLTEEEKANAYNVFYIMGNCYKVKNYPNPSENSLAVRKVNRYDSKIEDYYIGYFVDFDSTCNKFVRVFGKNICIENWSEIVE